MKFINLMRIYLFVFFVLFLTSCSSVQKDWKTDGTTIEKDIALSKKHGLMLFTTSDTDPQSKNLLENVFTDSLFSKIIYVFLSIGEFSAHRNGARMIRAIAAGQFGAGVRQHEMALF